MTNERPQLRIARYVLLILALSLVFYALIGCGHYGVVDTPAHRYAIRGTWLRLRAACAGLRQVRWHRISDATGPGLLFRAGERDELLQR